MLTDQRLIDIIRMAIISKLMYRFNTIPVKIPADFFAEIDTILKFIWKLNKIFKKNLENQVRKFTFLIKNFLQSYNNQDSVGIA